MRAIITFIFLATAVVLFVTQTWPSWNETNALRGQQQAYGEALANSRELQALKDQLLVQYNTISQTDLDRFNKMLPSGVDAGSLVTLFESRAAVHGLLLKKINIQEVKEAQDMFAGSPSSPYRTVNLSFGVTGSYSSVLDLLADLEKSLRIIDVNNVTFSAPASSNSYDFTFSAKTYSAFLSGSALPVTATEGEEANDILVMLNRLRGIKLDLDFFNNEIYKSLVDFTLPLEMPKEYGRPNPFASF